jgi:hypothetical protein
MPAVDTAQTARVNAALDEIVDSNRQDGDKTKSSAVLDARPGLGKTTLAVSFGVKYHREQMAVHGRTTAEGNDRIPVAYVSLSSNTTMRVLNAMCCRFYNYPENVVRRGNATELGHYLADMVRTCGTRVIIVDDVHFLDVNRREGRDIVNHCKSLASELGVTFIYVGVGLEQKRMFMDGLSGQDALYSQTARRWTRLTIEPFQLRTPNGRKDWRKLLLAIERNVVLVNKWEGMIASDLSEYLFARSTGHFQSLMTLVTRGCRRAIQNGRECLDVELLDHIQNDAAAERERRDLMAAFDAGTLGVKEAVA